MKKKGMIKGFPECGLEVDFCEHCNYEKQSWVRFPSRVTREKRILELFLVMCLTLFECLHLVDPCIMSPS